MKGTYLDVEAAACYLQILDGVKVKFIALLTHIFHKRDKRSSKAADLRL